MRLTVSLSEHESLPMLPDQHNLKSLSGDPAEPVDEAAYLPGVRYSRHQSHHSHSPDGAQLKTKEAIKHILPS